MSQETECAELAMCEKCNAEFPANISSPHPKSGKGDYCPECFTEVADIYESEKAAHFCLAQLPMPAGGDKYAGMFKGKRLDGNCHPAARELTKRLNLVLPDDCGAKVQRGKYGFSQHSWVLVWRDRQKAIIDPTRFQFTKETPGFSITTTDDENYDLCGFRIEGLHRNLPKPVGDKKIELPKKYWAECARILRMNPSGVKTLTLEQFSYLAHYNPTNWFSDPKPFFIWASNGKLSAFIPMEFQIHFGAVKDPDADVNTRNPL